MEISPNLAGAFEDSVRQIRRRFMERLDQQIEELDDCAVEIEQNQQASTALLAATEIVHRIAGVARTLGFPQLGHLAAEAEGTLLSASNMPASNNRLQALNAMECLVIEMIKISEECLTSAAMGPNSVT
jgi:HPt (histidine-containing phosphotransfer) domain-containing protein